jgi:plastocyanin
MKKICLTVMVAALTLGSAWSGSIKGKVTFEGKGPKDTPIQMNADPNCVAMHAGEKVMTQKMVIAEDGGLQWVFVYIKEGLDGKTFDPPAEPVVFDQKGCQYQPHVFGIQVGQPLKIHNSDATLHNVHIMPKENKEINISTPFQNFEIEQKFDKPEIMVTIKCDVHKWMEAYCGVLPHPFFAATAADGTYSIEGIPAGNYKLAFWQRMCEEQVIDVTVDDGDNTQDFKFDRSMARGGPK